MTGASRGMSTLENDHLGADGASQLRTAVHGCGVDVQHGVALAKRGLEAAPEPLSFVSADHYDGCRQDLSMLINYGAGKIAITTAIAIPPACEILNEWGRA